MLPADVVNRSLDSIGLGRVMGAFTDGTDESELARRHYGPTVRQILRAAHWAWARKNAPLQLLADATGQSPADPITGVPFPTDTEAPWTYAYAWPIDGLKAIWLPWSGTNATPTIPPPTTANTPVLGAPLMPARFLVTSSDQYPVVVGNVDWDSLPDLSTTEGVGQTSRRIILTDMPQASLVYTKWVPEIEEWDELFTQAVVATLGSIFAVPLLKDRKEAMAERAAQVAIAKNAITQARVANANDQGFPQTTNHTPDWIRLRSGGYDGRWGGLGGPGAAWYGWDSMAFADGSVM